MNLKKLLDVFKRKLTYQDFVITSDILKNKPVCYGELFKALQMEKAIQALCIKGKYHYMNVRANSSTINMLNNALTHNLCKTKNKYKRAYKEKALIQMSAFDNLMYAPKTDERISDNIIRLLLPNNKEYTEALDY